MIAYIRELAVARERWLTKETFADGVALSQTIPGATAMQVAAYVGLRTRGVAGALVSYVGFGLPAFFLMLTLSALYACTHNLPLVIAAFSGLQALIVAVVANAAISFGRSTLHCWQHWGIALIAAVLFCMMINPVLILLLAALIGMILLRGHSAAARTAKESPLPPIFRPFLLLLACTGAGLALLAFFSPDLARLALLMIKIDLFAFGGGFGSVPLMFHEIVEIRSWLDAPTFLDGIALGQFTPGPIVITATFVGYLLHGLIGAWADRCRRCHGGHLLSIPAAGDRSDPLFCPTAKLELVSPGHHRGPQLLCRPAARGHHPVCPAGPLGLAPSPAGRRRPGRLAEKSRYSLGIPCRAGGLYHLFVKTPGLNAGEQI